MLSYHESMTARVHVVHVCRYLLCVLAYVLGPSHYTEEHMYSIPLWLHTSACIYTHVHISVYNTQNEHL